MPIKPHKYWRDIILPIVRRDTPPTVPQAVVLENHRVLLVKRDNPALWELPGGGMRPEETPEQAVIREVYEETGVRAEIVELLGWYTRTGFCAHHAPVFICHPIGGELRPHADEASKVQYFPLSALPRGLFPWYRPILQQDVVSQLPKPLHSTQHLGLGTLVRCLILDLGGRLGLAD